MNNTDSINQPNINSTSSDIHTQKKEIRKRIKELKASHSEQEMQKYSDLVFNKLELLPEFQKAKNIFIYWSLPDELPTHSFIEKWYYTKSFILPSVLGDEMILKKYNGIDNLIEGNLGISEPKINETYEGQIDLVIVPGIAFDKSNNRLGRGKGFYDRFFNQHNVYKIGVCADFQLLDSVPVKPHDAKMDKIITPSMIL